jgi:aspartate kinase
MKVFKFGGASVKNAEGVKNVLTVLKTTEEKDLVVIVSAMGKMTNQLELIVSNYFSSPNEVKASITEIYDFHFQIISDLFSNTSHPIFNLLLRYKNELHFFFRKQ